MMHKVLQQQGVIEIMEIAVRSIAKKGYMGLTSKSRVADAIGTMAADWVSQLLGNVHTVLPGGKLAASPILRLPCGALVVAACCNWHATCVDSTRCYVWRIKATTVAACCNWHATCVVSTSCNVWRIIRGQCVPIHKMQLLDRLMCPVMCRLITQVLSWKALPGNVAAQAFAIQRRG
jgi:hypothetical protein